MTKRRSSTLWATRSKAQRRRRSSPPPRCERRRRSAWLAANVAKKVIVYMLCSAQALLIPPLCLVTKTIKALLSTASYEDDNDDHDQDIHNRHYRSRFLCIMFRPLNGDMHSVFRVYGVLWRIKRHVSLVSQASRERGILDFDRENFEILPVCSSHGQQMMANVSDRDREIDWFLWDIANGNKSSSDSYGTFIFILTRLSIVDLR
jgi:hypothetical protein